MKTKTPAGRKTKRILIVEGTDEEWQRFLKAMRRVGYVYVHDPEGVLAALPPRQGGANEPSCN